MTYIRLQRPNLAAALRDASSQRPNMRWAAAERLANPEADDQPDHARIVSALRNLLDDPMGPIRALAVEGLGALGDHESLPTLRRLVEDPHREVRQAAFLALGDLDDRTTVPLIREALKDPRPEMRFQALGVLLRLAPEQAHAAAVIALDDEDPEIRIRAIEIVGECNEALEVSLPCLDDETETVRTQCALMLARHGKAEGIMRLREALQSRDDALSAAELLGALGATEATEDLRRLARSFFAPVLNRAAAATALAQLGTDDAQTWVRKYFRKRLTREYVASRAKTLGFEIGPTRRR